MRTMTMVFVCATLAGCGSGEVKYTERDGDPQGTEGGDGNDDEIAIAGTWIDSFGITNTITNESWGWQYPGYPDMHFALTEYDNDAGIAVFQDELANDMGEKLWGTFEWTFVDDVPYYCQTAEGLATEEQAVAKPPVDHGNVTANCNGFAWFELIPI